MTLFLSNVLLAVAWMALTGVFTPLNLTVGFVLGYGLLLLTQRAEQQPAYFKKVWQVVGFGVFFAKELVKANIRVAYDVITPKNLMSPGVIAIPLDAKTELEITLLANLITLTPGTLGLEVSSDRRVLYIHAMYITDVDKFRHEIKRGLERRLLEVLR